MNMEQLPTSRVVSICLSRTLLTCAQQRLDADPPHTPMTAIPIDVEWRYVASDATSSVNPCLGVFLPSHVVLNNSSSHVCFSIHHMIMVPVE